MSKKYLLDMDKFSQALKKHEDNSYKLTPEYKQVVEYLCEAYSTKSIDFNSFSLSDLEWLREDLGALQTEDYYQDDENETEFHPTVNSGHPIYEYYRVVRGMLGLISSPDKTRPISKDNFI